MKCNQRMEKLFPLQAWGSGHCWVNTSSMGAVQTLLQHPHEHSVMPPLLCRGDDSLLVCLLVSQPLCCSLLIAGFCLNREIIDCHNSSRGRKSGLVDCTRFNIALTRRSYWPMVVFYCFEQVVSRKLSSLGQSAGTPDGCVSVCMIDMSIRMCVTLQWLLRIKIKRVFVLIDTWFT